MDSRTTFSDSNDNSGSSSICFVSQTETLSSETSGDVQALRRLSENLESIFKSSDFDFCSDAKIILNGDRQLPVHRCILSARSPFFRTLFSSREGGGKIEMKELTKDFNMGYDALEAVISYLYSGKVKPLPKDVCACVDEDCSHVACRPAIDFMVEVLYASFTFQISELVALYERHLLDILDKVATDDLLVILSVSNMCENACERLLKKCTEIVVKSDIDIITLEKTLPHGIVKQIMDSREELGLHVSETNNFPDKHVKRIHRALDSDDVELVRMLLKEGHTTLDDAYALHYAVAYCDAKTTTELLDLGLADVNHSNIRGYTVLHVAATRKEPKIIVSLLTKGARPSDLTPDGRKALQISKRLTKNVDYNRSTEEGKASPKDRLCIEILEQAERRDPLLGEASVSLAMAGDDLRMKLLYLENRVGLAKLLFPMEAKVAMDIAQVDGTLEFPLTIHSRNAPGGQRTVDLNEAPFKIEEEHLNRMRALSKTVELGKRFFPRCSEVLNKIMDADSLQELAHLGNDIPEERVLKRRRYMELQEILSKAFHEDKEEFDKSAAMSSSLSTTSLGAARSSNKLTCNKKY
ncbi:BTB/POZ domain and ankyrin repeat-containing protein NPR1-like [Macadamia integrifolia]|uniref:BTB/POZ domain and ankyrin repeat-containing protein NPR1-like n=1 Tax=Macadamia integrifolia TaxID=60698 RepID=UPI001C4FE417|nr:BTB/POZ domain and ankyrin repeat-containing protein NPR1-like [Macadamia integrifolia]